MTQVHIEIDKNKALPIESDVKSLELSKVVHLMKTREGTNKIPFRPKAGDVYLYKPTSLVHKDDWRADGYRLNFNMLIIIIIGLLICC